MINMSGVQTFSDQDILNILRMSLVSSSIAIEYGINGRSLQRTPPGDIQKLISEYEWRIYRAQNGMFVAGATRPPE